MKNILKFISFILIICLISIIAEFIYNIPSHTFNAFRYYSLYGGGDRCLEKLKEYSNEFTPLGTLKNGKCKIKNAVEISSYKETQISSKYTLSCPTALKIGKYFKEIKANYVEDMGTNNCRTISGSNIMSEHSYGTAIDLSKINDASVKTDWNKNTEKGKLLSNASKVACKYFSNIITPSSDAAHHDHFHFDNGYGRKCF